MLTRPKRLSVQVFLLVVIFNSIPVAGYPGISMHDDALSVVQWVPGAVHEEHPPLRSAMECLGSGDGRIHVIPSLSSKSVKNGDHLVIEAVITAVTGVSRVEAQVIPDITAECSRNESDPIRKSVCAPEGAAVQAIAAIELTAATADQGGVNDAATVGLWRAEWKASGLSEGYYRIILAVADREGHKYVDRTLVFTDPIAGNNIPGTTDYPNAGMKRIDSVRLQPEEDSPVCALVDVVNGYAYFGCFSTPGSIVKIALGDGTNPPMRVGVLWLNAGENNITCGAIDAAGGYAYFGTYTTPGIVVKVALGSGSNPPVRVASCPLDTGEDNPSCMVVDSGNGYGYLGIPSSPSKVVKVSLGIGDTGPQRVTSTGLSGIDSLSCAVIDTANQYAYFGTNTAPGIVVKVALGSGSSAPSHAGHTYLSTGEDYLKSGVIDTANGYAYFGTNRFTTYVIKVALGSGANPPTRVSSVQLLYNSGENYLTSAVLDAANGYAYFGTDTSPGRVVKILLGAGAAAPTRASVCAMPVGGGEQYLRCATIDAVSGYAYFGADSGPGPFRVSKVRLGTGATAPSRVAAETMYRGDDNLYAAVINSPAGYACFGTGGVGTWGLGAPVPQLALASGPYPHARGGTCVLNNGEDNVRCSVIDTINNYMYFGIDNTLPYVVKVAPGAGLSPPTRIGSVYLSALTSLRSAVIDTSNGYAYFGSNSSSGRIVKVVLGTGSTPPSVTANMSLLPGEGGLTTAVIDSVNGYAYFGTSTSPARVIKVALGTGAAAPSRIAAITLATGDNALSSSVIDTANGYAYFGTGTSPGRVVKVALGSGAAAPTRLGTLTLNTGENNLSSAILDASRGCAYFGTTTSPAMVVRVALGAGVNLPTRLGVLSLDTNESSAGSAVFDQGRGYAYIGTLTAPGRVVRVGVSPRGFVKATKFSITEEGRVASAHFYSHAAQGSLRMAVYDASTSPVLLWESPVTVNTASGSWLTVPINTGTPAELDLPAGDYWFAWQIDTDASVPSYSAGALGDGFYVAQEWASFPAQLQIDTPTAPIYTNERWSTYVTYTLPPPAAPDNPGGSASSQSSIVWTWRDNSNDETGFRVFADLGSGPAVMERVVTDANTEEWEHTGLSANAQYAFQVASTRDGADSSKTESYTTWTLIEGVSGLNFADIGTSNVDVNSENTPSNLSSGASGLYFENVTLSTNSGWQQNNTCWTSGSLTPNTPYTFRGKSRNGESIETAEVTAVKWTLAAQPGVPSVSNADQYTFDVTLNGGDGNPAGTEYAIQVAPDPLSVDVWVQADGSRAATPVYQSMATWGTITVTGLAANTLYAVVAIARNGEGVDSEIGLASYGLTVEDIPPIGTVQINGGAAFTNQCVAALTLFASDNTSGVTQMRFSNDNALWSSWEAYGTSKTWLLSSGDGTKTVYVQYRDSVGNASVGTVSDTITLDTVAPSFADIMAVPAEAAEDDEVMLTFNASEILGAAPEVTVNGHAAKYYSGKTGYTYGYTVLGTDDDPPGPAYIEMSGADMAGNQGAAAGTGALTIIETTTVPVGHSALLTILSLITALGGVAALRRRK